ncbi:Rieske 2Fe-2S domain-containing protein [Actinomadura sp. 21ATH]|uniref:Rieske 2Fe-2S domain-containing protein n=1 Tax=Actinomadura sp. 21ATH TaxID=1735444 RepID=UPI0035BEE724
MVARPESEEETPGGWFAVAFGKDVPAGRVARSEIGGRELVVYRTGRGDIKVISPYCPHLGAHLGYGGRVRDEEIVCPFHGFAFGPGGACTATGNGAKPPKISLTSWPSREVGGLVLAWRHPAGLGPQWEPDDMPGAYPYPVHTSYLERIRLNDVGENSVDLGHFTHVHKAVRPEVMQGFTTDGHRAGGTLRASVVTLPARPPVEVHFSFRYWGMGLLVIDFEPVRWPVRVRLVIAATPAGRGSVRLRVSTSAAIEPEGMVAFASPRARRVLAAGVARAVDGWVQRGLRDDIVIWTHKTFLDRPRLADGDQGIAAWRRWVRQFYELDPAPKEVPAPAPALGVPEFGGRAAGERREDAR